MDCVTCKKWYPCVTRPRFLAALAPYDGKRLNASAIGRALHLSHSTIDRWIHFFGSRNLLWLLPDLRHPRRRILVLQSAHPLSVLLERLQSALPAPRFHSLDFDRPRGVHVIAYSEHQRIGFCFQQGPIPRRRDWLPLRSALRSSLITTGFALQDEKYASIKARGVLAVPWASFEGEPLRWLRATRDEAARREAVRKYNREHLPDLLRSRYQGRRCSLPPDPPLGKMPACS